MTPDVSIIMPAYNAAALIAESIASVQAQTHSGWELIVVDDGSSDSTGEIVQKMAATDERIRYIRQENGGQASARNTGIERAVGSSIAFLDSDDLWLPEKLERQIAGMRRTGASHCYTGYIVFGDAEESRLAEEYEGIYGLNRGGEIFGQLYRCNSICLASVVVTRAALNAVGPFEPDRRFQNVEDYELWLRMASHDLLFLGIEEQLTKYRRHPGAMTFNRINMLKAELNVLERYREKLDENDRGLAVSRVRGVYRRLVSLLAEAGKIDEARLYMRKLHECDRSNLFTMVQRVILRLYPSRFNHLSERIRGLGAAGRS